LAFSDRLFSALYYTFFFVPLCFDPSATPLPPGQGLFFFFFPPQVWGRSLPDDVGENFLPLSEGDVPPPAFYPLLFFSLSGAPLKMIGPPFSLRAVREGPPLRIPLQSSSFFAFFFSPSLPLAIPHVLQFFLL